MDAGAEVDAVAGVEIVPSSIAASRARGEVPSSDLIALRESAGQNGEIRMGGNAAAKPAKTEAESIAMTRVRKAHRAK